MSINCFPDEAHGLGTCADKQDDESANLVATSSHECAI